MQRGRTLVEIIELILFLKKLQIRLETLSFG
jgi:hypothetical protein